MSNISTLSKALARGNPDVLGLLVVVPHTADEFFVLGDNTHSIDSRYFGAVKRDAIVGTAALIYRPRSGFRVFP